jgi:replicative DNA helicase
MSLAMRGLPHSEEAERSVLGSLFRDPRVVDDVVERLEEVDFYDERHRIVFAVIRMLHLGQKQVDLVTVSDKLRTDHKLEPIGGDAFLMDLADGVLSTAGVEGHCDLIRQKACLRQLIGASNRILERAYEENEDAETVMDKASTEIMAVQARKGPLQLTPIIDVLPKALERIATYGERGIIGIPTGIPTLDETLRGFRKQALIILGARPGVGKTALALNFALTAALGRGDPDGMQHPVLIFSMEMGIFEIVERLLCISAGLDASSLYRGQLPRFTVEDAVNDLYQGRVPILVDDTAGLNILELRSRCKRAAAQLRNEGRHVGMIIIDYLQLMQGPGNSKGDNRQNEIAQISRGLKQLAKELDVPVIALSQLSRESAKGDVKPQLFHLRESGSIEQDADVVMFLYREDKDNADEGNPNEVELLIRKNRAGPMKEIMLNWKSSSFQFTEVTDRYERF